jgi:hypothetical protein
MLDEWRWCHQLCKLLKVWGVRRHSGDVCRALHVAVSTDARLRSDLGARGCMPGLHLHKRALLIDQHRLLITLITLWLTAVHMLCPYHCH